MKAALHPNAYNEIFNVGEEATPTMGERLALLPHRNGAPADPTPFDYSQPFVLNTGKIRARLGYNDVIDENTTMRKLAAAYFRGTYLRDQTLKFGTPVKRVWCDKY